MEERKIHAGRYYRHFKGHVVKVLAIGIHTETEEQMVIYTHVKPGDATIWVRPLEMFQGKVDREKYPDVEQEYRFALMVDPVYPQAVPTELAAE